MIPFHAIFARKHGEAIGYPVLAAFDEAGRIAIYAKFEELRGPKGDQFRAEHAEVQLINNLDIETEWKFPDPATVEAERKAKALAEARKLRADNEIAQKTLKAAKDNAESAKSALKTLSSEQQALLDEADAAENAGAKKAESEKSDEEAASAAERERAEKASAEQTASAEASAKSGSEALVSASQKGTEEAEPPGQEK
jgi:hypothetical protein